MQYGWTPLMIACTCGHKDALFVLLSAGADIEATTENGQTALIWASAEGKWGMVDLLLKLGANKDHKNNVRIYLCMHVVTHVQHM